MLEKFIKNKKTDRKQIVIFLYYFILNKVKDSGEGRNNLHSKHAHTQRYSIGES